MKNFFKKVYLIISLFCVVIFTFITLGFYNKPENIVFYQDVDEMRYLNVYSLKKTQSAIQASSVSDTGEISADISFLGVFPVGQTDAVIKERKFVSVGGDLIGIKIYTDGLLVVGVDDVVSDNGNVCPAEDCGIKTGDIITHINDEVVTSVSAFSDVIMSCQGEYIGLTVKRNDNVYDCSLKPVYCESENKYRCGLWLKDSTAGIGTMTFCDEETGMFASLGHAICDNETKSVLKVGDGDIYSAVVTGCDMGQKGDTGQIKGTFTSSDIGDIYDNNEFGIYGSYSVCDAGEESAYPLASQGEVRTGAAKIISTVSDKGKQMYDIEIEKINYSNTPQSRSLVIEITDPELLALTGGIVQGMSGSPIIQDGKLVGAVTHVFLNDPTRGYGIFAETMLDKMNSFE